MTLLEHHTELILLIALSVPESALAHLQVHRSLYKLFLPNLYQHHLRDSKLQEGIFWCTATSNEAAVKKSLRYGADVNPSMGIFSIRYAKIPFQPWFDVQAPRNIAANTGNYTLAALLLNHGRTFYGFPSRYWGKSQPAVVYTLFQVLKTTIRSSYRSKPKQYRLICGRANGIKDVCIGDRSNRRKGAQEYVWATRES